MHSTSPVEPPPQQASRNPTTATNDSSTGCSGNASASSDTVVPVTFVSSVGDFQAVFRSSNSDSSLASERSDAFLLCYEQPTDAVTSDALVRFQQSVEEAARLHGTRLRLFLWDCGSPAFASAKTQLEKQPGHPLLLIVFRGAIADSIRGVSLAEMTATEIPKLCGRLASFQSSAKPACVTQGPQRAASQENDATEEGEQQQQQPAPQHLSVDVARMVGMGKKLMAERKPFYAEKFFVKSLQTLDSVSADVDRFVVTRADYDGSVALCLAWAGLAQLIQGKQTVDNPYLRRLRDSESLRVFREEPLSDACRAVVMWELMQAAPRTWSEAEGSEKKLREVLKTNPHDVTARSLLVVTLFLSGDLERAMTEALKLHVCGESYGRVALKQMSSFLGHDHALVKQLGIPALLDPRPT
ncbi:hypothetical protein ABB37_00138 [Leptomonas pyrrhocoris]|uniref:Uncharacterized protein n=1 Tax=Leptomonas pyrrhocoris TaxID=157538 RepID=A0A0N0DZX7_LEPPY|nr:hypothetical protein ABB37_00138 [Leptomonas pyrrhocoris]KPA85788.1 hypothetical protein ABB37_00138 [Leptomonas pyrrhocoris]|eukprot:XP_015664227.1 hypothetical protein ABB37_00138 [Leptomonas pyrrhocoris]